MLRLHQLIQMLLTVVMALLWSVCFSEASAESRVEEVVEQVTDFAVYVPSNPADCGRQDPWASGRWRLMDGGAIPSGGCLSLSYTVTAAVHTVLVHQGPEGELTRLAPDGCGFAAHEALELGEHWFPASAHGRERLVELDGEVGMERFHLLVLQADSFASLRQLASIPSLTGRCEPALVGPRDLSELQALVAGFASSVGWHIQSIEHY